MTEAATALRAIVSLLAGLVMLAYRLAHAVQPQLRGIEGRLDLVHDPIRVGRPNPGPTTRPEAMPRQCRVPAGPLVSETRPSEARDHRWSARCARSSRVQ